MKNKNVLAAALIGLVILSPFIAHEAFLFIAHDFSPDHRDIDTCLDRGRKWDHEARACIHGQG